MTASRGLQRAKRMLHKRCQAYDWYLGVGIVPAANGLGLRVNVSQAPGAGVIPDDYYGYSVEVVEMATWQSRPDSRA